MMTAEEELLTPEAAARTDERRKKSTQTVTQLSRNLNGRPGHYRAAFRSTEITPDSEIRALIKMGIHADVSRKSISKDCALRLEENQEQDSAPNIIIFNHPKGRPYVVLLKGLVTGHCPASPAKCLPRWNSNSQSIIRYPHSNRSVRNIPPTNLASLCHRQSRVTSHVLISTNQKSPASSRKLSNIHHPFPKQET
jgi:hypothetical protein